MRMTSIDTQIARQMRVLQNIQDDVARGADLKKSVRRMKRMKTRLRKPKAWGRHSFI